MKFKYCSCLLFLYCPLLFGMKESEGFGTSDESGEYKREELQGFDIHRVLVQTKHGLVEKFIEKSEEGHRVEKYFLIDKSPKGELISEFYFSEEKDDEGKLIWYGKIAYRNDDGRPILIEENKGKKLWGVPDICCYTLKGEDAKKCFETIKKRYEKQRKKAKKKNRKRGY